MTERATIDAATLAHLQTWQGRTENWDDTITAAPLRALTATLDHPEVPVPPGTPLPALWHWLYFLPHHRQSVIGADGHAHRGEFHPPVPLQRRMWAGGRLQWATGNPLKVGDTVQRVSRIASVTHKAGRSGELVFVVVRHEVHNTQGLALQEEHDIVYRAAAQPGDPVPPPTAAEPGAAWQRTVVPDDVLLFRYSALTFNGHRIHYDRRYVTEIEGYPGLVVHGPLIATLLADLLRRQAPTAALKRFEFKAVRPTYDLHPFQLNGQPSADGRSVRLWAQDHEGWLTMQASAELV
jgi:3-methylfumaryl-CoA hydratase